MGKFNQNYNHFNDRLKLRFKMSVSKKEYRSLCERSDYLILKKDDKRIKIQIEFKEIKLNCYKDLDDIGRLTTVFKPSV